LDENSRHMSLPVLRKLRDLVSAGAVVVGPKPIESPSAADSQAEFKSIADQLWTKGRIEPGRTIEQALTGVKPDFAGDARLMFVHRRVDDGDVYWVSNPTGQSVKMDAGFRVAGKTAEFWHAESATAEPASYRIANGRTTVPLNLAPHDAVFVVFRKPATRPSRDVKARVETELAAVSGAWNVAFQPNRGAPASVEFKELSAWNASADAGVKYFSGTATYTKTIDAPAAWFKTGAKLLLDLGDVKNVAEVTVNGKPLGIAWKAPFRVDLTGALKAGANTLSVKVANLWVNRLIGDEQPGVTKKITFTTRQFYTADSPLLPSGLLGPVRLLRVE